MLAIQDFDLPILDSNVSRLLFDKRITGRIYYRSERGYGRGKTEAIGRFGSSQGEKRVADH